MIPLLKYILNTILLGGLVLLSYGQCKDTVEICNINYDLIKTRKFSDVLSQKYKIRFKNTQTIPVTLGDFDTVYFYVKDDKHRRIKLVLENAFFKKIEFDSKDPGAFIARSPGTYQFKLRNRSFLNNEVFFAVKKVVVLKPVEDSTKAFLEGVYYPPLSLTADTVATEMDTILYVPCQLNLKKASTAGISFDLDSNFVYSSFLKTGTFNASLYKGTSTVSLSSGSSCEKELSSKQGIFEYCIDVYSISSIATADIPIDQVVSDMVQRYPKKKDSVLLEDQKRKQVQLTQFRNETIAGFKKSLEGCPVNLEKGNYSLTLENRDRVVGKYYRVRIRKINLNIKPKEQK